VAILATFMLRGPQTVGELRLNSDRLHRFADASAVEAFLRELAERRDGPLVAELPRAPGERENRWLHLLCGPAPPAPNAATAPEGDGVITLTELAALRESVRQLREEVETLQANIASLRQELGAGQ
jgi:uncharacterized protein YceH (UPF0502 family)